MRVSMFEYDFDWIKSHNDEISLNKAIESLNLHMARLTGKTDPFCLHLSDSIFYTLGFLHLALHDLKHPSIFKWKISARETKSDYHWMEA